ncbi:hypothetical protein NHU_04177 [Rhodovulum sulfidophilum]|uniref:Transposase n=1 Tax=Rhodovulum sulfidophilum TaxID=35806 RepID=A0A0D6B877_RHOSU|nr:hypothetical protein NHU_04177 [Rhodovulum sulfidophilum]
MQRSERRSAERDHRAVRTLTESDYLLSVGEKFETDQCLLSIFSSGDGVIRAEVINPKEAPQELADNEIRRCWLHVILDVATREVLGRVISETADADHSKALLRIATRDKTKEKVRYGCKQDAVPPVRLGLSLADNGTATRNADVYAGQLGMGMAVMTARAHQPMDKQMVERLFGTTQWDVLNFRPGYTGSRPGELTGYEPKPSAEISHDDLYGKRRFEWHLRKIRALQDGVSPKVPGDFEDELRWNEDLIAVPLSEKDRNE